MSALQPVSKISETTSLQTNLRACTLRAPARIHRARHAIAGSQAGLKLAKCEARVTMRKKDIHPEFFEEAEVYCNGEKVLTLGGTRPKYNVDLWSGNHPFFLGDGSALVLDEGRVNRFNRRYGGNIFQLPTNPAKAKENTEQ